jgi:(carboxyethyl)arginine beta-lactam-synthase
LAQSGPRSRLDVVAGGISWVGTLVGDAPTMSSDRDTGLVLAGELYNRDELAGILGVPRGEGLADGDLVLGCWRRYDTSALRLLNGRFALVLADHGRVVVATDHAGSLPLHVAAGSDGAAPSVRVATEAKALADGDVPASRVPAGAALVFSPGCSTPTPIRTWVPPQARRILPAAEAVARVRRRLERAVRARVGATGPPTVVLSGGIDSSVVAALTVAACGGARTVSLGTDAGDEFDAARLVARHLGTEHRELTVDSRELVGELAWAVWAAEITDPDVLEYLLPLVALYRRLDRSPCRILTGYGADIPLGGMHRDTVSLGTLDAVISADMDGFDGLNEMAPALSGIAGHWSTHPYWDRDVLDLLVSLEPGLKRRAGTDKWVLREAFRSLLPEATVRRRKLGIHEGSGTTSTWTRLLRERGIPPDEVRAAKLAQTRDLYRRLVVGDEHPATIASAVDA